MLSERFAVRSRTTTLLDRTCGAVRFLESDSEQSERSNSERKQTI